MLTLQAPEWVLYLPIYHRNKGPGDLVTASLGSRQTFIVFNEAFCFSIKNRLDHSSLSGMEALLSGRAAPSALL